MNGGVGGTFTWNRFTNMGNGTAGVDDIPAILLNEGSFGSACEVTIDHNYFNNLTSGDAMHSFGLATVGPTTAPCSLNFTNNEVGNWARAAFESNT